MRTEAEIDKFDADSGSEIAKEGLTDADESDLEKPEKPVVVKGSGKRKSRGQKEPSSHGESIETMAGPNRSCCTL